jgi:alkylation response protein AidB-like acyl-CoA dehydrogenase
VARAVAWATVSLAAEQLGAMESCLELTLEQVRTRHQFGRPIGGFQSIKHLCADLFVQVELARSAIARALDTEDDPAGLLDAASVAKIWCSDAFRVVAKEAIQLHGGIGFTWEHDAQLYYRRAHTDAAVLGQPRSHRRALAALHAW